MTEMTLLFVDGEAIEEKGEEKIGERMMRRTKCQPLEGVQKSRGDGQPGLKEEEKNYKPINFLFGTPFEKKIVRVSDDDGGDDDDEDDDDEDGFGVDRGKGRSTRIILSSSIFFLDGRFCSCSFLCILQGYIDPEPLTLFAAQRANNKTEKKKENFS